MPNLASVLKLLETELPTAPDVKTILIIELTEHRLAALHLRPSVIWSYAIVDAPTSLLPWGNLWRTLAGSASPAEVEELRTFGENSKGDNLGPELRQYMAQAKFSSPPQLILPIGSLSAMTLFTQILHEQYPAARFLPARSDLSLPGDLAVNVLRQEIARLYSPKADADYFLRTVTLDEQENKLNWQTTPLINKGDALPFQPRKLYRVISLPGVQASSVMVAISKSDGPAVYTRCINPPHNIFHLKCWFNYQNDGLGVTILDNAQQQLDGQEISTTISDIPLPTLKPTRYIDLAFIVDGTMRKMHRTFVDTQEIIEWGPDLSLVRDFIKGIVQQLEQDQNLDVRAGLCLYGDDQQRCGATYKTRPYPLQPLADFHRLLEQATTMSATKDLDYEAMLEEALRWANANLQWRSIAAKFIVVIGYAPPHPPHGYGLPGKYGFKHEPFTANINWRDELQQLRRQGLNVMGVWAAYPTLLPNSDANPCVVYSRDVWSEIAGQNKLHILSPEAEADNDTTRQNLLAGMSSKLALLYLAQGPVPGPLLEQKQNLRYSA